MIKLLNVDYSINGSIVLHGALLVVPQQKKVVVYYDREGGATTICKLVCGLEKPTSGIVEINGKCPTPQTVGATLLLAEPIFYKNKNAIKNLMCSAKAVGIMIDKKQIENLLFEYGILPYKKPKKMDAKEKLYLSFARARMFDKKIVVADDIFRNITNQDLPEVLEKFLQLIKGKTTLLFSSNPAVVLSGATKKYLHFGRLYDFVRPAPILQIQKLLNPKKVIKEGSLICKNKKIFIECENESFEVKKPSIRTKTSAKEHEKVYFAVSNKQITDIFDHMDNERM